MSTRYSFGMHLTVRVTRELKQGNVPPFISAVIVVPGHPDTLYGPINLVTLKASAAELNTAVQVWEDEMRKINEEV